MRRKKLPVFKTFRLFCIFDSQPPRRKNKFSQRHYYFSQRPLSTTLSLILTSAIESRWAEFTLPISLKDKFFRVPLPTNSIYEASNDNGGVSLSLFTDHCPVGSRNPSKVTSQTLGESNSILRLIFSLLNQPLIQWIPTIRCK